jgi:hypothetical protein
MRFIEFIVKSVAVCLAIVLALRIPIFAHWVTETDQMAFYILAISFVLSVALTGFAVFGQRRLARYAVLGIVGAFFGVLAAGVFLYPTVLAWNMHGFWGAAVAFCLPGLSHAWAFWVNIRQGMWGYAMVLALWRFTGSSLIGANLL